MSGEVCSGYLQAAHSGECRNPEKALYSVGSTDLFKFDLLRLRCELQVPIG